ncbi:Leucine-rich repeat serine/threonine-protein kinase 2 [Aphanomyces cochlioides]|nr:Leucine-rich repeat serine/threonine-protein kinase 2 [Aphanomyces cochlioides]
MNPQDGYTLLYVASANGHLEIVKDLLGLQVTVDKDQWNGTNALTEASRNGHLEVVKELLTHGASAKIADRNGVFPLHAASRNGHLLVLELLAKGASVDKRDKALLALDAKIDLESWDGKSKTPLYEASENGHVEVVKELLDHRANVNKKAWDGSTAIFGALWKGDLRIVELLLNQDASVKIFDQHDVTPLHVASTSKKGSVDIVRKLLAKAWRFCLALRLILGAIRCCKRTEVSWCINRHGQQGRQYTIAFSIEERPLENCGVPLKFRCQYGEEQGWKISS